MITCNSTKTQILSFLRQSKGWLSGEHISAGLGISRAAVAKHINSLRAEGHWIEAVSHRGYWLKMEADAVDINLIKKSVQLKALGQGQWFWREKTGSTNIEAAALGQSDAPGGSMVLANMQNLGRGRKGRKWFSAPRSIQFSILLRPALPASQLSVLSLLACLAMQKTLETLTGAEYNIKWPNDIIINNKKVAAVLVEANIIGGEITWAVLGIGCNLNAASQEFPEELRDIVTSVYEATGQSLSRNYVYGKLIAELDNYYATLLTHSAEAIITEWKEKTKIVGKNLSLAANGQIITGKALDINSNGLLVVQEPSGKTRHIEVGDCLDVQAAKK